MEIEILTTKKKLSKSLVLQMKSANLEQMKYAVQFPHRMLRYVTNLSKEALRSSKLLKIKHKQI